MDPFLRLLSAGTTRKKKHDAAAPASSSATTRVHAYTRGAALPLDYFGAVAGRAAGSSASTLSASAGQKRPRSASGDSKSWRKLATHTHAHTHPRPAAQPADSEDESAHAEGLDASTDSDVDDAAHLKLFARDGDADAASSGAEDAGVHTHAHTHTDDHTVAIKAFRRRMGIKATGTALPDPIGSFSELPRATAENIGSGGTAPVHVLASMGTHTHTHTDAHTDTDADMAGVCARYGHARCAVLRNIEDSTWKEPTPVQMQSVPTLLAGRDLMAIAPTGSGKTAAYAIPLLLALGSHDRTAVGPRVIVLTPTKELAAQTAREMDRLAKDTGIRVTALTKSVLAGAGNGHVSATQDAADLVKRKRPRKARRGSVSSAASAEESAGSDADGTSVDEDDAMLSEESGADARATGSAAAGRAKKGGDAARRSGMPAVVVPHMPKADILVATPLMLVAALRHAVRAATGSDAPDGDAAKPQAIFPSLRAVVLDEVDKLLELGFLEQSDEILAARPTPELLAAWQDEKMGVDAPKKKGKAREKRVLPGVQVQCAMFSATMPEGIEELAMSVLRDPVRVIVGVRGGAATTVDQKLVFVGREAGKLLELRNMATAGWRPPVLIFVQSKDRAAQLHQALLLEGWRVDAIHGDRSAAAREEAIARFRRGETWILITTDLLARGVDFKGVNLVINYDFPQSAVSYIHRIGRTGRAGRPGTAVTFFTEDDIPFVRSIANVLSLSGAHVPPWMRDLKAPSRRDKAARQKAEPRRARILTRLPGGGKKSGGRRRGPTGAAAEEA